MKKIIRTENLVYQIPHGKEVLKDVSFELYEGEFLGVLGRNGVGKTTLIDLCLGLRTPTSGSVYVLDENPLALERQNLEHICFIAHDSTVKDTLTVRQYFNFVADLYPSYKHDDEKSLLEFFNIDEKEKIGALSTGQKKKVLTIGALATRPKLILIDEVTAVLDPESRDQFFKALHHYKSKHNMSIVLATNIAEDLIDRADRVLFIDKGVCALKHPSTILELFSVRKVA